MTVCLGIDTSNYKTSVALVEDGRILADERRFLKVKRGEKGLRQQEALFQHINNLPQIIEACFNRAERTAGRMIRPDCIAVSTRPRSLEGSYMPVFMAGTSEAESMGTVCHIPVYRFSHQEGHIRAARYGTEVENRDLDMVFFHFSGGTTEAVDSRGAGIIGGTRDLAVGQVLDRAGVLMGMDFPAGEQMDRLAVSGSSEESSEGNSVERISTRTSPDKGIFTSIRSKDGFVNLSGIDTQCKRLIEGGIEPGILVPALFHEITVAIARITVDLIEKTGYRDFLFAGGVSSSLYIRKNLKEEIDRELKKRNRKRRICPTVYRLHFAEAELASDNAVGVALLGGESYGY